MVGYNDDPMLMPYMSYFKLGDGPLYMFYRPFHLTHLEAPLSVARAVLFGDATIAPAGGPVCEVTTMAKRRPGGGRGAGRDRRLHLLRAHRQPGGRPPRRRPAHRPGRGARLTRPVAQDQPISNADVELPEGRWSTSSEPSRPTTSACLSGQP